MKRNQFIHTCSALCLSGIPLAVLLQSCGGIYYAFHQVDGTTIIVKKSEFVYQKKEVQLTRKFVVIQSPLTDFPICLYQINSEEYSALLMKCTHKGCEVRPNDYGLTCPCHGSEFDMMGKVTNPPAERSLTQFKVSTDDHLVYIPLS